MAENGTGLILDESGVQRCYWQVDMSEYHDNEWGRPVADDRRLFEKICLEGFQAGLAWITILRKRENFRAAFEDFDFHRVARYTPQDVDRLMQNEGIVRNRAKIASTVNNAKRAVELVQEYGSLAGWIWQFEPHENDRPEIVDIDYFTSNPTSKASTLLSKELKKRGWTFVGPTTMYAFMQAVGMVNDHLSGCFCRDATERERAAFERPRCVKN